MFPILPGGGGGGVVYIQKFESKMSSNRFCLTVAPRHGTFESILFSQFRYHSKLQTGYRI